MSKKELTLYKICLEKVAYLLKHTYWNAHYEFDGMNSNPFTLLPSSIIDELIVYVTRLSVSEPLKSTDLYHLISTGQVRNFKLEDVHITFEDFVSILMSLSVSCQNLVLIKIKNVFCTNNRVVCSDRAASMKAEALECVLNMSPRLESVESCIEFNLKALRNAEHLKKLKLNFTPQCHIYDFLEEDYDLDGTFWPNNSLKVLELFEDARHPSSSFDIAIILKYCTELVEINCDVSKSLEFLHIGEFYNGSLCAQYKLEKCCLGSIYLDGSNAAVSRDGVYITSLTCPNLREVDALVMDDRTIYALCDFPNLTSLLLQWEVMHGGNFLLGVQILLEKIGPNLKILHIINFSDIDFSVIGINCPNLEELRVEYISEHNAHEFPPTSFHKLTSLHIENIDGNCQESSLVGLLSNCTNLKLLTLQLAESLTDSVLSDILKKNSLSKVREARIYYCTLSSVGLQNLASNLMALEYLEIRSSLVPFDVAASIVHGINPQVIMSYVTYE